MSSTIPESRMVRLGDLIVDPSVQRNTVQSRVDHIGAHFDMAYFGIIVVSLRANGDIHVIDGATRRGGGLKAMGQDFMVPALVYTGLSIAQEADMFLRLNDTRQIPPLDRFKVRLVAQDPDALAIASAAATGGWEIGRNVMAIGSIEDVYTGRAGGVAKDGPYPTALAQTFVVLSAAWGHTKESANGHIIKGVGAIFLRHPEVDPERLVERLVSKGTAGRVYSAARSLQEGTHNGLHKSVFMVCVNEYNKRLRIAAHLPNTW